MLSYSNASLHSGETMTSLPPDNSTTALTPLVLCYCTWSSIRAIRGATTSTMPIRGATTSTMPIRGPMASTILLSEIATDCDTHSNAKGRAWRQVPLPKPVGRQHLRYVLAYSSASAVCLSIQFSICGMSLQCHFLGVHSTDVMESQTLDRMRCFADHRLIFVDVTRERSRVSRT